MKPSGKKINTLRLRIFLNFLLSEQGGEFPPDIDGNFSEEARQVFAEPGEFAWISAEVEAEIINRLCYRLKAWPLMRETGRECMQGLFTRLLDALPERGRVRDFIAWLPSFILIFNHGLNSYVEEREGGGISLELVGCTDSEAPRIHDILFAQGLLEGLLAYLNIEEEVRIRFVSLPRSQWPPEMVADWLKFDHSRSVLRADIGDLNQPVGEVGGDDSSPDRARNSRDSFMQQVMGRSARLFQDKRELTTTVEYLHLANEELEKKIQTNRKELRMAAGIQARFIPASIPDWEGLQFWVHSRPVGEVSGDIYDYFYVTRDRIALHVSDVSGHGVPAALISAIAKLSFREHKSDNPASVFTRVNMDLINYVRQEGYLTSFYMSIDRDYHLRYCIGGMMAPLLFRARSGEVDRLKSTGTILGMFPDASRLYLNHGIDLEEGDKIIIFTDGILEAQNPDKAPFGIDRLEEAFRETRDLNIGDTCEHILQRFRDFILGSEQSDDMTLVGIYVSENRETMQKSLRRARELGRQNKVEEAIEELRKIIKLFPNNLEVIYLLGKFLAMNRQYDESFDTIKQYRAFRPYHTNSLVIQAACQIGRGLYDQAEDLLKLALYMRSTNNSALFHLARLYSKTNRKKEAREVVSGLMVRGLSHPAVIRLEKKLTS